MLKWMVAAAVILAVGATLWNTLTNDPNEKLFAQYFEPYRNVIAPVVRGDASQDSKTMAFAAYEKAEFDQAATHFTALLEEEQNEDYRFYLALSYLGQRNGKDAIPLLSKHIASNGRFKDKAKWYLALAFLISEEKELARDQLKQVMDSNAYNTAQAEQLLRQLKK